MTDEEPYWPLLLALRLVWIFVALPFAIGLLWLLQQAHLPRFIDWTITMTIGGALFGTGRLLFFAGRRR